MDDLQGFRLDGQTGLLASHGDPTRHGELGVLAAPEKNHAPALTALTEAHSHPGSTTPATPATGTASAVRRGRTRWKTRSGTRALIAPDSAVPSSRKGVARPPVAAGGHGTPFHHPPPPLRPPPRPPHAGPAARRLGHPGGHPPLGPRLPGRTPRPQTRLVPRLGQPRRTGRRDLPPPSRTGRLPRGPLPPLPGDGPALAGRGTDRTDLGVPDPLLGVPVPRGTPVDHRVVAPGTVLLGHPEPGHRDGDGAVVRGVCCLGGIIAGRRDAAAAVRDDVGGEGEGGGLAAGEGAGCSCGSTQNYDACHGGPGPENGRQADTAMPEAACIGGTARQAESGAAALGPVLESTRQP